MPELPEVESFARSLNTHFAGKVIKDISFHRDDIRFPLDKAALKKIFKPGARFEQAARVGKQLQLQTNCGSVYVSLGMSGAFFPASPSERRKHEHVTLRFQDGTLLGYEDARRFGFWKLGPACASCANPLDEKSLLALFLSDKARGARSVKALLLDQQAIGGLGNIYVVEALFLARIHPAKACFQVTPEEWKRLARCVPALLEKAIELGGSSISTYKTLHGSKGGFQSLHKVYGREGQKCVTPRCPGIVARLVQQGRSSWYCPRCQP